MHLAPKEHTHPCIPLPWQAYYIPKMTSLMALPKDILVCIIDEVVKDDLAQTIERQLGSPFRTATQGSIALAHCNEFFKKEVPRQFYWAVKHFVEANYPVGPGEGKNLRTCIQASWNHQSTDYGRELKRWKQKMRLQAYNLSYAHRSWGE